MACGGDIGYLETDNKVDGKVLLQITSQYLDRLGVANPTSRDKLLAAVHELKLFGGPIPDERQFRLNVPGTNNRAASPRTKRRSLPARPANMQRLMKGILPDSAQKGNSSLRSLDVVERKTPQEVLQEQAEEMMSETEKGKVQVQTTVLNPDTEYTSIEITNRTTSKELVRLLLEQCDALSKDYNLFYIAVEIGIQKKDSGLPISHMMVLADDARPLEIQSRQATGEAKFHLKMRSGGLLRVQAGILSPGATYKCVQISRQTRADDVVKMILSSYGSDEPPEKFVLVESLSDSEVGRILEADECPLEVQSRWKAGEQGTFTLTLAEFEGVLQGDEKTRLTQQESFSDKSISSDQQSSSFEMDEKECLEQVRKRRTSIDALDLHIDLDTVNSTQVKRKVSQIDNLRHKFQEYHHSGLHRKPSSTRSVEGLVEGPKKRKVSQIDVFRSKFLAYYGGKMEGPGVLDILSENVKTAESNGKLRSRKTSPPLQTTSCEHSDGEELPHFSSSPPNFLRDNNNNKDNTSQKSIESEHKDNELISQSSRLSLANVLQNSKLITVTLNRSPGEGWGIELVHVTKTGSSMGQDESGAKDEEKVVYVQHNGNGQNSIMSTSCTGDTSNELLTPSGTSTPRSGSSSGSSEHEIAAILGTTSHSSADINKPMDDMRHIVHKQNLRRKMGSITNVHLTPEGSPISSRPGSASHLRPINPLPPRPSSALAQWRKEGSPQHRPGVRIVALTEDGIAEKSNELAVDDLIVEINGQFVLNSPLEPVIAAMKEANTVTVVVARAQSPEPKPEEKENKTDYKDDIKALTLQIQNLVTKVSEMQSDLKKKDDKIKTLKKMVKKSGLDSKGKIYQSVQVLV
ncbi:uncharacterized protein LOC144630568 isoform X2 [Oculina patagonica]